MPSRRTIIVSALPVAIMFAFGAIGVIASRCADSSGSDAGRGLPFASEPTKAKWQPGVVTNAQFTYTIEAPRSDEAHAYELTREGLCLDNKHDLTISGSRLQSAPIGLLVNNEAKAERIIIDDLSATDCTEYGGYIFGVSDLWIRNSTLHQGKGATQHGLRVPLFNGLRVSDSVIDSRLGDKTSLWIMMGDRLELRNVRILGGRNWFSINPDNPDLPNGHVSNVVIADCWMDLDEDQDWSYALEFMPGVNGVTITNLHVRCAKPPIGVWPDVSGAPAARDVHWKDIWIPAPGQPRDKPFDDLQWVKLRDDDWDRVIGRKIGSRTLTREELITHDIGPLP